MEQVEHAICHILHHDEVAATAMLEMGLNRQRAKEDAAGLAGCR
jgi:hypothetical protein